jgi:hypothetical protein
MPFGRRVLHYSPVAVNPSAMSTIRSTATKYAAAGVIAVLWAAALGDAPARAASIGVDNWATRPGVAVRVLLLKPTRPTDAVLLLAGGHGNLNLDSQGNVGWGEDDVMLRTRRHFFNRDIAAIVPDVATDHKPPVSLHGFRTSAQQADDVLALVEYLRAMAPKVWIVAYDTGATSALNAVARDKADGIAGLVLVSPILEEPKAGSTLLLDGARLAMSRFPVLVVAHEADSCSAPDVERIKQVATAIKATNFQVVTATGGRPRFWQRDPFAYPEGSCNMQPAHALAGLDNVVADKIVDWIHLEGANALDGLLNPAPSADSSAQNAAPIAQVTPLSALPEPNAANFHWTVLRGLNAQTASARSAVADQPVLRLIATPDDDGHTLAAQLTGLNPNQIYRIAAWVKPVDGGNAELAAYDRSDLDRPPNSGHATFDLYNHEVMEAVGVKESDIEQHADNWQKIWIDLATSDGEFVLIIRPAKGKSLQFVGDGRLGLMFGGFTIAPID